ncbi:aromatic peroxygenase-like, partial [Teratosphaeria destructans]
SPSAATPPPAPPPCPPPAPELGLDGHNKFEGDTSLTRNDYFLANGDNYDFNQSLYNEMSKYANGAFNRQNLALYRYQRYNESRAENGNFYFGPKSVLLFGAASFLYELFPSLGELGTPDQTTMDYFFQKEQIPPNWYSRVDPYTIPDVAAEILAQYELHPVAFGGNTGTPDSFVGLGQDGPYLSHGMFTGSTPAGVACLLYQVATENDPAEFGGGSVPQTPQANLEWMAAKINPFFTGNGSAAAFGCPIAYNDA